MSTPTSAVLIRFGLEEAPDIHIDAHDDGERVRLCDWIDAHPDFFRLIAQLFALIESERAA